MNDYHEPTDELGQDVRDLVRALTSLKEEIEAIDWYQQRMAATQNEQLKAVLAHNQGEEMEHASMALEWLRRRMPAFDKALRIFLFTDKDIAQLAEEAECEGKDSSAASDGSLGVGSFKVGGR
jgi:ferritin-like protein